MSKRTKGDGSLYLRGRIWWMSYQHPDGTRRSESTGTERRPVALGLLRKRTGAAAHNLPVIPKAEQVTFHAAARMVVDDFVANHAATLTEKSVKKQLAVQKRRAATGHLSATSARVSSWASRRMTSGPTSRRGWPTR
jgi:hypothetical protein